MQDNDSAQNAENKNSEDQAKITQASLITSERSQKLDLLIHLISNLRQSLVLCGPNGIGKTVLLDEFETRQKNDWAIATISGSSSLSYESIQDQIFHYLKQDNTEYNSQHYSSLLSDMEKQNKKVVILIDDAGQLVPGLISSLLQYATDYPCLRLVFALTADELHIKNSSDKAIDDCHFIEIPPLTEKQCGVFLQLLSAQPRAIVPYKAINDRLVEKLYRETHGIPGKIVAELPNYSNYSGTDNFSWFKVGGIIVLLLAVIGFFISDDSNVESTNELNNTDLLLKKAEKVEVSSPIIETFGDDTLNQTAKEPIIDDTFDFSTLDTDYKINQQAYVVETDNESNVNDLQTKEEIADGFEFQKENLETKVIADVKQSSFPKVEKTLPAVVTNGGTSFNTETEIQLVDEKIVTVDDQQAQASVEKIEADDTQWVLKQPKNNITIQLMVLSKRESVQGFLKKNHGLKGNLKFFKKNKLGKTKYILIYGSFKNISSASKSMKTLPIKYRKSWLRKFKDLQKIINN